MQNLNYVDYSVIGVYFCFLVCLGLYLKKKASASLEDYFLGGRKLPWWAVGFWMGYKAKNINDIWGWIIMGLGGGMLVPRFLRLYWWRFNGGGFAVGMTVGLIGAVLLRLIFRDTFGELQQFGIMLAIGLTGAIVGTYLTPPCDREVLEKFYRKTRPFGFWGKLKETLPGDVRAKMEREHKNDLLAVPFALGWQVTLFMLPMQLILQSYKAFAVTFSIFLVCLLGVYIFWFRNLSELSTESNEA